VKRSLAYEDRGQITAPNELLRIYRNKDRARWKGALWMGPETELVYMRNRWYEPRTGRFISEDPIGLAGGINPLVFAANNPVSGRDPTGLAPPSCPDGYVLWEWVLTSYYNGIYAGEMLVSYECRPRGGGGSGAASTSEPGTLACISVLAAAKSQLKKPVPWQPVDVGGGNTARFDPGRRNDVLLGNKSTLGPHWQVYDANGARFESVISHPSGKVIPHSGTGQIPKSAFKRLAKLGFLAGGILAVAGDILEFLLLPPDLNSHEAPCCGR
jgi:RHS repeat-associated protein